jgi:hypothetical protein
MYKTRAFAIGESSFPQKPEKITCKLNEETE